MESILKYLDSKDIEDFKNICKKRHYNPNDFKCQKIQNADDMYIQIINHKASKKYYDFTSDLKVRESEWPDKFFKDLENGHFD